MLIQRNSDNNHFWCRWELTSWLYVAVVITVVVVFGLKEVHFVVVEGADVNAVAAVVDTDVFSAAVVVVVDFEWMCGKFRMK